MSDAAMLDHVGWQVSDYPKAIAFYTAALKPLGWKKLMEFNWSGGSSAGFGKDGKPVLWISSGGKMAPHVHLALAASSRAEVDSFYKAAMKAGATDNGGPGIREDYSPTYYAAFVLDPDGHNIEAVTHLPAPKAKATPKKKPAAKKAAPRKRKK